MLHFYATQGIILRIFRFFWTIWLMNLINNNCWYSSLMQAKYGAHLNELIYCCSCSSCCLFFSSTHLYPHLHCEKDGTWSSSKHRSLITCHRGQWFSYHPSHHSGGGKNLPTNPFLPQTMTLPYAGWTAVCHLLHPLHHHPAMQSIMSRMIIYLLK